MMKNKIILLLSTVICVLLLCYKSRAQDTLIRHDTLYSKILQEKRPLQVIFPGDYLPGSSEQYEIIYVLDGTSTFIQMEWNFLQGEGFIPKNMIMIGVEDTFHGDVNLRDRDFTPTRTNPVSGGAKNFLAFFKEELMPYISVKYHAKPGGHTLYGGSLGGLFVMYAFLNEPMLFTSYVAVDPSLWWDNFYMHKLAVTKLDSVKNFHNTLWIAGRQGNPYHFMGTFGMDSLLQEKTPVGLDWKCTAYPNESHYSTNFKGFYEGMKYSYGGFYASTGGYNTSRTIFIKPRYGRVIKDKPFQLLCFNLVPELYIHYTVDGSAPVRSSPKLAGEITLLSLSDNTKLRVKSFGMRDEYNKTDSGYFLTGEILPAMARPKNVQPGGLQYTYYEGEWDKLPDLKKLRPTQAGFAGKDFDVNHFGKQKSFVCVLDGHLEITRNGYHIFEMGDGNEYSKVFIGDTQLLGEHFVPENGEFYLLPLQKGFYPFRIVYVYKKGGGDLVPIYLKPEGIDDFPIAGKMLYSRH
ncbi:alpha/beta hydrolase-fold protein [Mucilaginibacter sp. OK098]|uniref:alpha/beta hydrolase-fold protein n=1 Tax=Mucilaginibacter sp. OK098 TaxID=1855297 RepID=UPI00091BE15F|nr:alpha/beta hydrolase-fold protein [Mucilaginibacter sp. OK098]SHM03397.1 Putative esterase [Mucilaginibacter sp. OK098]